MDEGTAKLVVSRHFGKVAADAEQLGRGYLVPTDRWTYLVSPWRHFVAGAIEFDVLDVQMDSDDDPPDNPSGVAVLDGTSLRIDLTAGLRRLWQEAGGKLVAPDLTDILVRYHAPSPAHLVRSAADVAWLIDPALLESVEGFTYPTALSGSAFGFSTVRLEETGDEEGATLERWQVEAGQSLDWQVTALARGLPTLA